MANSGKLFERQFQKSVPPHCYLLRLNDPPQSFSKSSATRFSPNNPFDFILFDTTSRTLVCVELKTTKYKSISFESESDKEKQSRMIHAHQIDGLTKASKFDHVAAGFLLNFRDEKNDMERCYWQNIEDFNKMVAHIGKCSFNEIDLLMNNAVKVEGTKKIKHYIWDIDSLLPKIAK